MPWRYDVDATFNPKPAKHLRAADLAIFRRLALARAGSGSDRERGEVLAGELGVEVLGLMLATGRCRWQDAGRPAAREAGDRGRRHRPGADAALVRRSRFRALRSTGNRTCRRSTGPVLALGETRSATLLWTLGAPHAEARSQPFEVADQSDRLVRHYLFYSSR